MSSVLGYFSLALRKRGPGRQMDSEGAGAGAAAGSPAPEAAPLRGMAALGRRWRVRLFLTLQSLAARRALHDVAPPRDVLLFEHERGRFFAVLGLFCAGQGVFWASLAIAALARPPASTRPPDAESPGRGRLDLRSALWRYGLAVGCGAIGKVWFAFPAWVEEGGHNPLRLGKKSKGLPTLQDGQATLIGAWYTSRTSPSAKPSYRFSLESASHSVTLSELVLTLWTLF